MKMGPCCKNPGRVLLHLLMVGLLSQVMDKANVNVVNKNIEPVCACEVKDNVGVLTMLAMHSVNSVNSETPHDPENLEVTREEAEVKWVIRNAVDDGEMMKQDEAPKNGEDIKKELTSAADITDDTEDMGEEGRDDGSFVEDDREHLFQREGFEDTKEELGIREAM
jgi:hypothetical protein